MLAAQCLPEAHPTLRDGDATAIADQIAKDFFDTWWPHQLNRTATVMPDVTVAYRALDRVNAWIEQKPLRRFLVDSILVSYPKGAGDTTEVEGLLVNPTMTDDPALTAWVCNLEKGTDEERKSAVEALRQMHTATATEAVLAALVRKLEKGAKPRASKSGLSG